MGNDYRNLIIKLLNEMDESDEKFMLQIYTIVKKHLDKKKKG